MQAGRQGNIIGSIMCVLCMTIGLNMMMFVISQQSFKLASFACT